MLKGIQISVVLLLVALAGYGSASLFSGSESSTPTLQFPAKTAPSADELEHRLTILREDNQRMRSAIGKLQEHKNELAAELVRIRKQVQAPGLDTMPSGPELPLYWLSSSSQKRHNQGCRWYRRTTGLACTENEGTPCDRCGG